MVWLEMSLRDLKMEWNETFGKIRSLAHRNSSCMDREFRKLLLELWREDPERYADQVYPYLEGIGFERMHIKNGKTLDLWNPILPGPFFLTLRGEEDRDRFQRNMEEPNPKITKLDGVHMVMTDIELEHIAHNFPSLQSVKMHKAGSMMCMDFNVLSVEELDIFFERDKSHSIRFSPTVKSLRLSSSCAHSSINLPLSLLNPCVSLQRLAIRNFSIKEHVWEDLATRLTYLRISGGSPLWHDRDSAEPVVFTVLDTLCVSDARWLFQYFKLAEFPVLETLHLSHHFHEGTVLENFIDWVRRTPSLKKIELKACYMLPKHLSLFEELPVHIEIV